MPLGFLQNAGRGHRNGLLGFLSIVLLPLQILQPDHHAPLATPPHFPLEGRLQAQFLPTFQLSSSLWRLRSAPSCPLANSPTFTLGRQATSPISPDLSIVLLPLEILELYRCSSFTASSQLPLKPAPWITGEAHHHASLAPPPHSYPRKAAYKRNFSRPVNCPPPSRDPGTPPPHLFFHFSTRTLGPSPRRSFP
jgi:hypothetical protein